MAWPCLALNMGHPLTNSLTGEEIEVTWESGMFLPIFGCVAGTQPAPVCHIS
ncbi:hypothetical protein CROQUDRAFT_86723 [Cronartium quercuum f. sp. fusiforme G11]|uniref:Uncharacterized protein n=1 Tax=Cronartium quercuum f. sp. fusiforme G11 TaxID=708437 RepID=A0A9P6TH11_9BASI|nr:hypothetical protein CROQUDRAFT_86723 [Cronartium quercuum f. sp. fusiforme G11]